MVHDTLLPWCSYLDWEPEPSIVKVANVQHLGSQCRGPLVEPGAERARARAGVVSRRRPSAATRAHEALELIASVEGFERGPYGGAVGWVDASGNGTWAVAHPLRRAVG